MRPVLSSLSSEKSGARSPRVQMPGAGPQPEGPKGKKRKGHRAGHSRHDLAKPFRRLMHGPPDVATKRTIYHHEANENPEKDFLGSGTQP